MSRDLLNTYTINELGNIITYYVHKSDNGSWENTCESLIMAEKYYDLMGKKILDQGQIDGMPQELLGKIRKKLKNVQL